MPSVHFCPALPHVIVVPRVPLEFSSDVYYSKDELTTFKRAERQRCQRIVTKGSRLRLQSRILQRNKKGESSAYATAAQSNIYSNNHLCIAVQHSRHINSTAPSPPPEISRPILHRSLAITNNRAYLTAILSDVDRIRDDTIWRRRRQWRRRRAQPQRRTTTHHHRQR